MSTSVDMGMRNYILDGKNYLEWSKTIILKICSNELIPFLSGTANARPNCSENQMVMSMLLNSMNNDIRQQLILPLKTAKEIWDAARQTYSYPTNNIELRELETTIRNLRQGDLTVTKYFNALCRNWQLVDTFKGKRSFELYSEIGYRRTLMFLFGLNSSYDQVVSRIVIIKPLHSLHDVFSQVQEEESRLNLVRLGHPWNDSGRGLIVCRHCFKVGHFENNCWIIHGKPIEGNSLGRHIWIDGDWYNWYESIMDSYFSY